METKTKRQFDTVTSFEDMDLSEPILRGIYAYGFERPTAIQQKAIIPTISGTDIIAQAQSGTGKTGTFSISALQLIDPKLESEQAIILSPTRELAKQTHRVINSLSHYMDINIKEMIGGQFSRNKDNGKPAQIIVGTPGKVLDELSRGRINSDSLKLLILDEADEMLSKGFMEQIYNIFQHLPSNIQVALFSATMPNEVLELSGKFMRDPYKILVKTEELTLEGLKQYYVDVQRENFKFDTLCDLYSTIAITQCIIYCNSKNRVIQLSKRLAENNFTVSYMYGDMQQSERNKVMESFRSGSSRILITTDILARGIDVQQVSLVINYDLPHEAETYVHRVGRTGRLGRKGVAINFCSGSDFNKIKFMERFYNTKIYELPSNIGDVLKH
jgi:translation initiation factor 4A